MTEAAVREAYSAFLGRADIATWEASLDRYREAIRGAARAELPRLAEGLCLAVFTRWLASLCGDVAVQKAADATFEELAQVAGARDLSGSRDGTLVNSVIAAGRGYHETAEFMLGGDATDVRPEIQLLIMPTAPAKRARALRGSVREGDIRKAFLPAVYFYAHAVLDLGYLDEVREVLDQVGERRTNSLMVDLDGKLCELKGAWKEAYDLYRSSGWDQHRYRASICSIILHASEGGNAGEAPWMAEDETLKRAMLSGRGESDQAEAIRSASFVNACRWHDFDSWLVHYELGSLSFSRRRHAEADEHLRVASQRAPDAFRFAIDHLRFVNLTWLTNSARERSLPAEPELLECGHAALAAPGEEADKAKIRIYIAEHTEDMSFLQTDYDGGEPDGLFEQGNAYEVKGWVPHALRCWSQAVARSKIPRAFHRLIRLFESYGFEETADHLVEIALREAWDDFFWLWELGQTMLLVGVEGRNALSVRPKLAGTFSRLEQRLADLADADFQHLIRAWGFYRSYEQASLAARMLWRAGQLAESAEEHLLLACARRPKAGETDRLGLESLLRAERESTHRVARLEIARELVRYGQIARAREILKREGALDASQHLAPLEYVLVLECGTPCLAPEEASAVAQRAMADLTRDRAAGLYAKYGDRFAKRLREAAAAVAANIGALDEESTKTAQMEDSVWQSWKSSLERLDDPQLLDEERRFVESQLSQGDRDIMLFFNLTLWGHLHETLESIMDDIKRIRPDRPPSQTPISRSDFVAGRKQAKDVSRLWRDYLAAAGDGRADAVLAAIGGFYRDQERLEREWEALRVREMQGPLRKAGYLLGYGRSVLERIRDDHLHATVWPSFLGVRECVVRDTQALDERLQALMSGAEAVVEAHR